MLTLQMDPAFKVGDTASCTVNGKSTEVTWVDEWTLRLGTDDTRHIVITTAPATGEDGLRTFYCSPSDTPRAEDAATEQTEQPT